MPQTEALKAATNYEITLADLTRRSERRAWWVAAAASLLSVIMAAGYFYFIPLQEKVPYLIMADAYDRLKQFGRTLDFGAEAQYVNAAACLAVQAKASGLKQVDHVVQGKEGRNLIAVQGRIDDPGNLWVHVDKALAAAQPIQLSTMQIDFLRQKQPPERARETADTGMAIGR